MRLLVMLSLMVIHQVSLAKGISVSAAQRVKLKAIYGDKIKYRLSSSTRRLIKAGELIPVIVDSWGLRSVAQSWQQMLAHEATVDALDEIAKSPKHLEEAKELLVERYGEEHAEYEYDRLVDLLFIKSQIEEGVIDVNKIGSDINSKLPTERQQQLSQYAKKLARSLIKSDTPKKKVTIN